MSSTGYIIVSVVLFDDDGGLVNICFTGTCTVTLCNGSCSLCVFVYVCSMCMCMCVCACVCVRVRACVYVCVSKISVQLAID